MAKLFLSYSRKDEARARRLTEWLEREGHDVWRDEDDIGGGTSFSAEIERALSDCDAVLVLWSKQSVQSAWVRDEAAFGRDAGKLIPFSLDGTEPPLGFRQFQAIALSGWKGRGAPPNAERIQKAITRTTNQEAGTAPELDAGRRPPQSRLSKPLLAAGIIALGAAVILAIFLWHRSSTNEQIAIAVVPSPQSPDRAMAGDYANAIAADMAAFLPRRFDRATVIGPGDAGGGSGAYRMLISTDPHGRSATATLTLSDEDGRTTLWSKNWSVADAGAVDLKAEVSAAASKAGVCLGEARTGSKQLSQPALGLYLTGCSALGDPTMSTADFGAIFERVTKLAPDFPRGWDYLALSRAWIASGLRDSSPAAYAAALRSARETIAKARKLNPDSAMSYDAEYHLISNDTFRALQVVEQGAKIDPDDGRVQMHLSNQLLSVGRVADSVQAAERGVELEPVSPYNRSQYILALIYSGEFSKAKADIAEAQKKWPNDPSIAGADFTLQLSYGDPRQALNLLPQLGDVSDADLARYRTLISARLDPTPGNIDKAVAAFTPQSSSDPSARNDVLLALGNFGRLDQVYQLLEDPSFQPFVQMDSLFRPSFAAVRADPRFMQVAARLGLVRYWRQTGYWPDFCRTEQLRYDCKTEAAKYTR